MSNEQNSTANNPLYTHKAESSGQPNQQDVSVASIDLNYVADLLKNGDVIEATKILRSSLVSPERNTRNLLQAAELFLEHGLEDIAETTYRTILETESSCIPALGRLGDIAQKQENYQEAVFLFHQILENQSKPDNWVYIGLGNALEGLGEIEDAIFYFRKAIANGVNGSDLQSRVENLKKRLDSTPIMAAFQKSTISGVDSDGLLLRIKNLKPNLKYPSESASSSTNVPSDAEHYDTVEADIEQNGFSVKNQNEFHANIAGRKLIGCLDLCDERGIWGWIIDENNPNETLELDIWVDGALVTKTATGFFRQRLLDAGIGNGCCAFATPMPDQFFDGLEHVVSLGLNGQQGLIEKTIVLTPELRKQYGDVFFGLKSTKETPFFNVDTAVFTDNYVLIIGWLDDRQSPLKSMVLNIGKLAYKIDPQSIYRYRRIDVEMHLHHPRPSKFGFWILLNIRQLPSSNFEANIKLMLESGHCSIQSFSFTRKSAQDIFNIALPHLQNTDMVGNPIAAKLHWMDNQLGANFLAINTMIVNENSDHIVTEYSPVKNKKFKQSIIVVLYGRFEYLFLQMALFSKTPDIHDTQFIYVINSPEIVDAVHREAKTALRLYGISIVIVQMKGNVGFSMGNNIGVQYAQSDRILIVNPDVFPKHKDWLKAHNEFALKHPKSIFGARLYYDDGSVMHAGMYFEKDNVKFSFTDGQVLDPYLVRVEHYCKGAPDNFDLVTNSRKVPAVTGAFMSCDKKLFEQVGGFSRDYIFGHYEDADLCLKFNQIDSPVWYAADVKLWHLEGKGSGANEFLSSASMVNRWSFTRKWGDTLPYGIDVEL